MPHSIDIDSLSKLPLPSEMPLIVLSDCFHFPGCLLPLYIFEERYKAMLGHALQGDRMFGVGVRVSEEDENVLPVVTAGLIRACLRQDDGTAHLMLLGLRRMKITGWVQRKPFPIARVEVLETIQADPAELAPIQNAVMNHLPPCPKGAEQIMDQVKARISSNQDPEHVCNIITYHLVHRPELLAQSLQEASLLERYRIMLEALKSFPTEMCDE